MLTLHFNQCDYPQEVVDDGRCSQCIETNDTCGPPETMQDSLEYLRKMPPRSPSSPASRRQRNTAAATNNPPRQDSNDPMRISTTSVRHGFTTNPVLPETLPTGSNAFQNQNGDLFGTDDIQGDLDNGQNFFGSFMVPSPDPVVGGSLGHTLGLEMDYGKGSVLSP